MSDQPQYLLRLYVTGRNERSERAIESLREICADDLRGTYELVVVDITEHPGLAEEQKILATPMVVKELPLPIRTIIGDLSDRLEVLAGLDLQPLEPHER